MSRKIPNNPPDVGPALTAEEDAIADVILGRLRASTGIVRDAGLIGDERCAFCVARPGRKTYTILLRGRSKDTYVCDTCIGALMVSLAELRPAQGESILRIVREILARR